MRRVLLIGCSWVCLSTGASAEDVGIRVRFGLTDKAPTKWDSDVAVDKGRVASITGWRFEQGDHADGVKGWVASTRQAAGQQQRTNNVKKAAKKQAGTGPVLDNGAILSLTGVTGDSHVTITTPEGVIAFALKDLAYGAVVPELKGAAELERVGAPEVLTNTPSDDDFPASATGKDGAVYLAYVSFTPGLDRNERARAFTEAPRDFDFLAKPTGGDQVFLKTLKAGQWSQPLAVTAGKGDIYKCAVAVDGQNRVWVVWSEQRDQNFDLWTRAFDGGKWSEPVRLTTDAGSDHSPVAATDSQGKVWIAWQGARDNVFRIFSRRQNGNGWTAEELVSHQAHNCWYPSIATDPLSNRVAIAWDSYDKGDYDVSLREYKDGQAQSPRPVANSSRYEARAALTYDRSGGLWVAWEESGETWGKNWGALVQGQGVPLYADRQIGIRVLKDNQWFEPLDNYKDALPDARRRRNVRNLAVRSPEPQSENRKTAQEAQTRANVPYNNISRITCDQDGRIWLLARSRQSDFRSQLGTVWLEYAAYLDGPEWVGPILLPHSDNLLYNLPAVAALPDGGLIVAHSTDHRQTRRAQRSGNGAGGNGSLDASADPFINDLYVTRLAAPDSARAAEIKLKPAGVTPNENAAPSAATEKERREVQRCRDYRLTNAGKELRILRGEFHRHTEISGDGGGDGPLEDMWRYAIDVASMDWIGCGDHDNGAGREYPWWLTQKTTDVYHLPGAFDPLFTYERSVAYPEGHRNVVFAMRGIRTLPRLPKTDRDEVKSAPDTQMLYRYLHHFGGICASHTSSTSMGTDWRDNDPVVEPFVEIYQGCRQNYERLAAPRAPTPDDAIGGWEPKGFVNLALLKGYRLAFESSSDHRSTHISYGLVYAEEATRQGIVNAMKKRHVYAATDNIVADVRCTDSKGGEHMLGDEFNTGEPPTLQIKLFGTAPFAQVVIVKDDEYVQTWQPKRDVVEFSWKDDKPTAGKISYYYVRGEQEDGELVWASPMWITYQPR